jgi:L-asparaginase II
MATDGCSAPTFRLPLARLAEGIARVADPAGLDPSVVSACERMIAAAATHPELVGGTQHRFDTDLLRVSGGRLFSKVGAEGAFVVGVVDGDAGYAFKIDDGNERALAPLIIDVLAADGHLSPDERAGLTEWDDRVRTNWDGLEIGHLEVVGVS